MPTTINKLKHKNRRLKGLTRNKKRKYRSNINKSKLLDNNITNLSDVVLTSYQKSVLNKGLTFVPSHSRINFKTTNKEILNFERKLQLHYYFNSNNKNKGNNYGKVPNNNNNILQSNSNFWPKILNPQITQFCNILKSKIIKLHNNKYKPNLTPKEILALKELRSNSNMVIKKGDKGAGIVILNTVDYINKINIQLQDSNTYTTLTEDTSSIIKKGADKLLLLLYNRNYINKKQYNNLTSITYQCPIFYGVPKIHKTNCPLRPIVSQTLGPCRSLHTLIDKYLTFPEAQIPYLLKDTTSFLQLIENHKSINNNSILVTLDVVSLYTNIPQQEGIEYVVEYYTETLNDHLLNYNQTNSLKPINPNILTQLLEYVLNNTIFSFNNQYFKQNYGCSMGAQSSVKYANIYMHKFFKKFFSQYTGYVPEFLARLVDDVLTIWEGTLPELLNLVQQLNNFHPTIKFELKYSISHIQFLDTIVYIKNNTLHTNLYTKPTDKKQYLYYSSSHPNHLKKSIPYSQALRYRRIISEDDNLVQQLRVLNSKFTTRNYPNKITSSQINKVLTIPRNTTLQYHNKSNIQNFNSTYVPLVLTFHPTLSINKNSNINHLLTTNWLSFLQTNPKLQKVFTNIIPKIVYRKHKTISNYVCSSKYPPPWFANIETSERDAANILQSLLEINQNAIPTVINLKCLHNKCLCCNYITNLMYLNIFKVYPPPDISNLNCNSTHIIYFIHCNKCQFNYVGQTKRSLKDRLNNHRSNIKTNKPTPIAIHFNQPQHSLTNLKIMPIHQFSQTYPEKDILNLEKFYINTYKTAYPLGINYYPINYK